MRSIKSTVGLLLLLLPSAAMAQNGPFLNLSAIPVGKAPLGVAIGDLNGDGFPDLVVTNSGDNTVSIILGNGDGSYQTPRTIVVGAGPGPVALADLNNDGKLDLVVGNDGDQTIEVLLGNGDGTFQTGSVYPLGGQALGIQIGDFTGDGILDVAVTSQVLPNYNGGVQLFVGKGDGTFQGSRGVAGYGAGAAPNALVAGDFDGNGTLDLAVTTEAQQVDVLLNDGKGNFTSAGKIDVASPFSITVGDFNKDSHLDLAVISSDITQSVSILLGNGNGTFQAAKVIPVGSAPRCVVAGDLNNDGNIDLVVVNGGDNTLSVFLGNGDGTFQTAKIYNTLQAPYFAATADVNHDGEADVVVTDISQNRVQVFLGTNDGTLFTGSYITGSGPVLIASGDLNGDGISDIAVGNYEGLISLYLADGHQGFSFSSIPAVCTRPNSTLSGLVIGDFQSAHSPSLVASCNDDSDNGSVIVEYSVDASGTPTQLQTFAGPHTSLKVADFNGDGISDLLLSPDLFSELVILEGGSSPFSNQITLSAPSPSLQGLIGDFNGDGIPDILSSFAQGGCYALLSGSAGTYTTIALPCGAQVSGDFNGDGLDDYLAVNTTNVISVNVSKGDGTFSPGTEFGTQGSAPVGVADFNGDGILDVLVAGKNGGLTLSEGAVDGSFSDSGANFAPSVGSGGVFSLTIGDFDNSGSQDVAVLEQNPDGSAQNIMDVFLNKNHFLPTSTALSQPSNSSVAVGQPISLSATVYGKSGVPTGQIVFKRDGAEAATVALVGGTAAGSFSAASTVGQYGFTALYTGDGTFSGSRSNRFVVTVNPAHSTTTVTSSGAPKLGQSFMVTATVAPQFAGTPTGAIQFYVDGEPVASSTLAAGRATASITETTMGKHTIEANYSGDANFITSAGVLKVTVGKGASAVSLAASANPALYGTTVVLSAKVTDSEGATATGPVVFSEGATIYGTMSLNGGSAEITLPSLAVGTHKITAQYGGDTNDATATGTISEVIQGLPTTTTVVSNTQPSFFGQSVTFTATISAANGVPDGTLSFKNGSAVLGTVTVVGGQATLGVSTLTAGTHTITALYNGGTSFAGSSGTVQQIVEKIATSTALSSSLNPAVTGGSVTFTAVVSSTAAQLPTGNVTFKDGKTTLGTVALVNGQAQLSTALLTKGTHTITASYAASTNFTASNTTLTQTMQ